MCALRRSPGRLKRFGFSSRNVTGVRGVGGGGGGRGILAVIGGEVK